MRYLRFVTAALAAAGLVHAARPSAALAPSGAATPNIVLILADDLGYAELGCYGQKKIRTPNLDRMAMEGVRFTQYYAGAPVCAPSRCVLLTGRHPGHAAVRNNAQVAPEGQLPIPDSAVTVAEVLKARGYATAAIGKWGLGPPGSEGDPNRQGFDLFFGYNCQAHAHNHYPTYLRRNGDKVTMEGNDGGATGKQFSHDLMEAEALGFIRDNRARPFFLYVPFTIPHVALQVPEDSLTEYRGKWEDPPYTGGKGYLLHAHPRAAYAAMITRMDRSVGRILAALRESGLERNTLVLFTSDNGPTHGGVGGSDSTFFESAGRFRGLKGSVYEGGIRVPFLARWPGRIPAGRTCDRPTPAYDVLPTLCEVAQVGAPAETDGVSFLPALLGKGDAKEHPYLYWEFPGYGGQQAVRMGDWKGVRQNLNRPGRPDLQIELYDLAADPGERENAADRRPEIVRRIARIMAGAHTPSDRFPLRGIDTH